MAKIDKMLEMIATRNVDRALMSGDRPFQLWVGGRKVEGSVTPAAQLQEVVEEIAPSQFAPMLRDGGAFHFRHHSPHGAFDIGAENFVGALQVTISPAKEDSPTPKGTLYSTTSAESPNVAREPYPGAYTGTAESTLAGGRPQAITPIAPPEEAPIATAPLAPVSSVPPVSANALSQSSIVCRSHPDRTAAGVCSYSGKFYCSDCLVEFDGKQYGKDNLSQVFAEAKSSAHAAAPTVVVNNSSQAVAQPLINTHASVSMPAPRVLQQSPKSRMTAGLLGILFGGLGVHRFYLGYTGIGLLQVAVTLCTVGWGGLWGFVEGILLLCGVMNTDSDGRPLQP